MLLKRLADFTELSPCSVRYHLNDYIFHVPSITDKYNVYSPNLSRFTSYLLCLLFLLLNILGIPKDIPFFGCKQSVQIKYTLTNT